MPRPDLSRVPVFYHNYISQVPQDELLPAIHDLGDEWISVMENMPASLHNHAYAPGKWTLKEVFQHVIDTERIMAYRALSIARGEKQSLPGFDENSYGAASKAANRSWTDLLEEFRLVRRSSAYLFRSFDDAQLEATGAANGNPVYVLAIGFILAGHAHHHLNVIRERYL